MSDERDHPGGDDPLSRVTPVTADGEAVGPGHNGPPDDVPPAPPEDGDTELPIAACAELPLNDYGNGRRFVAYFGDDVLRVPRVGWYVWTGQLWRKDPDEIAVRRKAQQVSGLIEREVEHVHLDGWQMELLGRERALVSERREAERETGDDGRPTPEAQETLDKLDARLASIASAKKALKEMKQSHRRFATSSGNKGRIDAILTESGVSVSRELEELDAGSLDVNTESGVMRFHVTEAPEAGMSPVADVELVPHARDQLITKMMPVTVNPDATAPRFHAFLERIQPSAEVRGFLQRWFGLSMSAILVQKFCFLYGSGANGKSVLVDLMASLMGDYAATAKIESLTGTNRRGGGDATPDLIPLVGARMVRTSEPEEGQKLQEGLIKSLTGGEPFMARGLNADFFEFLPVFKLTMSGNHKPDIRNTDDGIWRRVMLVPFDVQIPEDERDPLLGEKLWAEREGILNWLRDGLIDCLERGLQVPDTVAAATQEYREESDPVGHFLSECAIVTGSEMDFMTSKELIEAFNFWLEERGETRWGGRTVSLKLKAKANSWRHPGTGRTFIPGKSGVTGYRGVRLTEVFQRRFDGREGPPHSQGAAFSDF